MNRSTLSIAGVACAIAVAALAVGGKALAEDKGEGGGPKEIIFHPPNPHQGGAPTAGSAGQLNPKISYRGGPVMGTPHIYFIWYGNWGQAASDTPAGQQLIRDFIHGLSGSPYFIINTSYGGVSGSLTANGETSVGYTFGNSLTDGNILSIVQNAITPLGGTPDPSGIYLVLTSSDVTASSGFCTNYCGWHTHASVKGTDVKYAFIGNANRCLNACAAQTISPNGNAGVDGMISVIAHEVEEATTDPDLNAWYDSKGAENADKCAWTFGSNQSKLPSGAYYNMSLKSIAGPDLNFLVQRNLDVASKCYVDYVKKSQ